MRRNRKRVIDAAREALAEYGLSAQMDDLARRAGVGVGTVYRHFPTKDDLLGELIRRKLEGFADLARRALAEDAGDPLGVFASLLRAQPSWPRARRPCRRDLAGRPGRLPPDLSPDDVRALFSGLVGMGAADAHGLMRCDRRRQLEFSLEGMRPARERTPTL